ncbi:MAG: hypothetical protein RLZZ290_852 [Pseudomonadota bacterium]|jgi:microcin C transport system ATP-binding protein
MLSLRDFTLEYEAESPVLRGLSLSLDAGEVLCLVGESGAGKSSLARALMGLRDGARRSGVLNWQGQDIDIQNEAACARLRGRDIAWVPQDVDLALNPVQRIGEQVQEALTTGGAQGTSLHEVLFAAGLHDPERQAQQFPHELSGGERQRALIAISLACGAKLIIADEPTSALDLPLRSLVLESLTQWIRARGAGLLLLTHDLNAVRSVGGRMAVLAHGEIVETGPVELLLDRPSHPITRELLSRRIDPQIAPPKARDGYLDVRRLTLMSPPGPWLVGKPVRALVNQASFIASRGETLGIIGSSGSGKTSLALALLRLAGGRQSGEIQISGRELMALSSRELRAQRRRFQWVPQDPAGSLSPRHSVRESLEEALLLHHRDLSPSQRLARCEETLAHVGLEPQLLERLPAALSGGQRQRVAIARALISEPEILVLDEPTSALDWQTQSDIAERLVHLQQQQGLTLIWISHDLPLIRALSHRVVVMRQGNIVESGLTEHVFGQPRHSYTQLLMDAAFPLERSTSSALA